jgi:hypothetical protein
MQTRFNKEFLEMFFQNFEHILHNRMTMFVLPIVQQLYNTIMPFFLEWGHDPNDDLYFSNGMVETHVQNLC